MFYYVSVKVGEMNKHKISKDLCFKIVCSGKVAMAPKYMTAISIGNPGLSGVIIINDFNGASSVKRFSVPGQPIITKTIEKLILVVMIKHLNVLIWKVYLDYNCPYCVWNKRMRYYAFIDEIGDC